MTDLAKEQIEEIIASVGASSTRVEISAKTLLDLCDIALGKIEAEAELANLKHDMEKLCEADSEHLAELTALRAQQEGAAVATGIFRQALKKISLMKYNDRSTVHDGTALVKFDELNEQVCNMFGIADEALLKVDAHPPIAAPQEVERDAARLDFMIEDECQIFEVNGRYCVRRDLLADDYNDGPYFDTARAAIDQARSKQP